MIRKVRFPIILMATLAILGVAAFWYSSPNYTLQQVVGEPYEQPARQESPEERAERLRVLREMHEKMLAESTVEIMSGMETKGKIIIVGDTPVKLPDDVYVYAYIVDALCPVGATCPETPYYALAYLDDETGIIGVEEHSGKIFDDANAALDKLMQNRERFTWLYQALEQEKPYQ